MNKKLKIILIIVCAKVILLSFIFFKVSEFSQIKKFVSNYIGNEKAVKALTKWSFYYDQDWMKMLAILLTESEGKQFAVSSAKCKGYMMLSEPTATTLRERLKQYIDDTNIFAEEFNIAGGILYFTSFYNYNKDFEKTLYIYNCGPGNYSKGYRNYNYLKMYLINYTFLKTEWDKKNNLFLRLKSKWIK